MQLGAFSVPYFIIFGLDTDFCGLVPAKPLTQSLCGTPMEFTKQEELAVSLILYSVVSWFRSKYPFVTNCVNGDSNPSGYLDLMEQVSNITAEYPLPNMYRKPYCRRAESR